MSYRIYYMYYMCSNIYDIINAYSNRLCRSPGTAAPPLGRLSLVTATLVSTARAAPACREKTPLAAAAAKG